jgi:hypothetical protein
MRFFCTLADWCLQRLFWLCVVGAAGTAQADVILYQQSPGESFEFSPIAAGEIRSQPIDLTGPAQLESISLNLAQPPWMQVTGTPSISLWIDRTPGSRSELIYSGGIKSTWTGLAVYLPKGRSWLSVEALAGSGTVSWISPIGTTGGALTTASGTVDTAAYAGTLRGTPVPEPAGLVPVAIVAGIVGAGVVWRRVGR